jgi:hypothetical protein
MTPVDRSELMDLGAYEQVRERFLRRVIEEKKQRRVALGSNMSVVFENRDTVLFQIQEMLRTERITKESGILHELETYNELIPDRFGLSVSIFVEYPERDERERMLQALAGLEERWYVRVGDRRIAGMERERGDDPSRTTAVHYVKFALGEESARLAREGTAVLAIGVDHPAYSAETELPPATRSSLKDDLSDQ